MKSVLLLGSMLAVLGYGCGGKGKDPDEVFAQVSQRFAPMVAAIETTTPTCSQPAPTQGTLLVSYGILLKLAGSSSIAASERDHKFDLDSSPPALDYTNVFNDKVSRANYGAKLLTAATTVVIKIDDYQPAKISDADSSVFVPGTIRGRAIRFDAKGAPICVDVVSGTSSADLLTRKTVLDKEGRELELDSDLLEQCKRSWPQLARFM